MICTLGRSYGLGKMQELSLNSTQSIFIAQNQHNEDNKISRN